MQVWIVTESFVNDWGEEIEVIVGVFDSYDKAAKCVKTERDLWTVVKQYKHDIKYSIEAYDVQ